MDALRSLGLDDNVIGALIEQVIYDSSNPFHVLYARRMVTQIRGMLGLPVAPDVSIYNSDIKVEKEKKMKKKKKITGKTTVVIYEILDPDEQLVLKNAYSDFDVVFHPQIRGMHGFAAAKRKLDHYTLHRDSEFSVSVGGNDAFYAIHGIRCHSCTVILDAKDSARMMLRKFIIEAAVANRDGETPPALVDYVENPDNWYCQNKAQDCSVQATDIYSVDSNYDIPLMQVPDIMIQHGATKYRGCMLFSPAILVSNVGYLPLVKAYFLKYEKEDLIEFYFLEDSSLNYTHCLSEYMKYASPREMRKNGKRYYYDIISYKLDTIYFQVMEIDENVSIDTCTVARYWMDHVDDLVVVKGFGLDMLRPISDRRGVIDTITTVSREAFTKTLEYAYTYADGLKPLEVYLKLYSWSCRRIYNGAVVIIPKVVKLPELINATIAICFIVDQSLKSTEVIIKHLDYNDNMRKKIANDGLIKGVSRYFYNTITTALGEVYTGCISAIKSVPLSKVREVAVDEAPSYLDCSVYLEREYGSVIETFEHGCLVTKYNQLFPMFVEDAFTFFDDVDETVFELLDELRSAMGASEYGGILRSLQILYSSGKLIDVSSVIDVVEDSLDNTSTLVNSEQQEEYREDIDPEQCNCFNICGNIDTCLTVDNVAELMKTYDGYFILISGGNVVHSNVPSGSKKDTSIDVYRENKQLHWIRDYKFDVDEYLRSISSGNPRNAIKQSNDELEVFSRKDYKYLRVTQDVVKLFFKRTERFRDFYVFKELQSAKLSEQQRYNWLAIEEYYVYLFAHLQSIKTTARKLYSTYFSSSVNAETGRAKVLEAIKNNAKYNLLVRDGKSMTYSFLRSTSTNYSMVYDGDNDKFIYTSSNRLGNGTFETVYPTGSSQYFVTSEMELVNQEAILASITALLDAKNYGKELVMTLKPGVPGCGKTYGLVLDAVSGDLLVSTSREGSRDIVKAIKRREMDSVDFSFAHRGTNIRTFDSVLIRGCSTATGLLHGDESLMTTYATTVLVAYISGLTDIRLYGDPKQIPFFGKLPDFKFCANVMLPKYVTVMPYAYKSYRCPPSAVCAVNKFYDNKMVTTNTCLTGDFKVVRYDNLNKVTLPKRDGWVYMVFYQDEKANIPWLEPKTVGELQGKSQDNVMLVRTIPKERQLFDTSTAHHIVALTRHKVNFVYVTVSPAEDGISSLMKFSLKRKNIWKDLIVKA